MYHSISTGTGPTCIPADTFLMQLDVLAECGCSLVSLGDVAAWHRGESTMDAPSFALTFDDGFQDFADVAAGELLRRQWPATVFLPTGRVGGVASWDSAAGEPHPKLMSWQTIEDLSTTGIEWGAHGVTHADLTKLPREEARAEVIASKKDVEDRLQRSVRCFAPPYGKSSTWLRREIAAYYEISVGTRLDRARRQSDRYDMPRIEMHYFRDRRRWRNYLLGQGESHFAARRVLRNVRRWMPHLR